MDQPLTQTETASPAPEKYIRCHICDAIIGFMAHVGHVQYLHVFAYSLRGCRNDMDQRKVNAVISDGKAICTRCGTAHAWPEEKIWHKCGSTQTPKPE